MITEFIKSFVMLLVIMDPFGGIPIFLSLTSGFTAKEFKSAYNRSTIVAGVLVLLFLFLGMVILDFFSISLESFKIAGGIILLIVGITFVMDIQLRRHKNYHKDITVPMATPLISGPGVLTTVIILVSIYGYWIPLVAAILNLFLFWLLMKYSKRILAVIGIQGSEILSRIMGLILTAMAIEFIVSGIQAIMRGG